MAVNGYSNGYRLLKREDLLGDPWHPLDGIQAPEYVPPTWDGPHVGKRLADGLRTLMLMPNTRGPRGHGSSWPAYAHDWADQLAQAEMDNDQRERIERARNKTRIHPSSIEIANMDRSIRWPLLYLREFPQLTRTVQAVAVARSRDRDMEDAARKLQLPGRLVRKWNLEGLALIARGLIREHVRIF